MLTVNDHIFGSPREMLCVAVALALHVPLYFWQARPDTGVAADPITEIDFMVEEEEREKPPPPPEEKKETTSFFKKIQEAVGLATPKPLPKLVIETKPKTELAGLADTNKIQAPAKMAESMQQQARLVEKDRTVAGAFDVGKIETKGPGLAGVGMGPGDKLGGGTLKEKSSAFKIAQGDLPFAVKKSAGGLADSDADAPRIALSNKTDKRVTSVSTAFFGTGGGTGGGDGAGEGGGGALKDKSGGKGLVGVSGGFSRMGAPGTVSGSGGGGLVGVPSGKPGAGGAGAGGGKVPYEISGSVFGRGILYQVLPKLPDWAKEKGLFAIVRIDFFVRHTGEVNVNKTIVRQSSGYPNLDTTAMEALNQWRFAPLDDPAQKGKEQTGTISFTFKAL